MKRFTLFILTACTAALIAGCTPAANTANTINANANTNANANAAPKAAAPTADSLMAQEKQANEAWIKGDSAFFEGFLADKFVMNEGGQRMSKAEMIKMIGQNKCDMKSWELTEPQLNMINADTALIVYKGTFDGSCGGQKVPSPVRAASVYIREGDKWKGAYHGETLMAQAGAAPDKKEEAKPAKKEEPKPAEKPAAANSNANTTAAKPAPATPSANTEALGKLHKEGWTAWMNKDAKWFEDHTASSLSFIDPMGTYHANKADTIKFWTVNNCQGVTKVDFMNAFATAISPTVEILTGKGTSDGTCDGQKNGPLDSVAVYVKEGDAWKMAFLSEQPAK